MGGNQGVKGWYKGDEAGASDQLVRLSVAYPLEGWKQMKDVSLAHILDYGGAMILNDPSVEF